MKIKLALSNYYTDGKIPQERKDLWHEFNGSFSNKEISIEFFPILVQQGYAYTAQHKGYRKAANFVCTQFLAVDYDKGTCTFETLLRNDFIRQWCYFLHTTPSHTKDNPRSRVVFVLDQAVDNPDLYGEMAAALTDYFELSDNSCKDPARFFYGSKNCDVHKLSNILPVAVFNEQILKPYREKRTQITEQLKKANSIKPVQIDHVPARLLEIHRAKLCNHIATAVDGKKHLTILQICKTLGGYIGGGYYNYADMVDYCKNAIIANPHNVKDLNHAFNTIETALQYGINEPLYFEDHGYGRHVDAIRPALSEIQKQQIHVIVAQAIDETKALSEEAVKAWQQLGVSEPIINIYNLGYQGKEIDYLTGEILQEETFVVPFCDNDKNILNIEYRFNDTQGYENDMPFLFTTDRERQDQQMVVLPDSLTALHTYLHLPCDYNIVGLPHMRILKETIDYDGAVVLLEPDTDEKQFGFNAVKDHCRFLRLNKTIKKLLENKIDATDLGWYIKQAVKK